MLRHRHASATSCAFHSGQRQFTAPSLLLRQMSGREPVHGAGLVKHEPMSGFKKGSGGPAYHRFISEAPPAADLFRTAVHEGLGTGPQDPYRRTLPNQPSVLPESTVLTTPSALAPTLDERKQIDRKWGTIQYWVGGKHPRLPIYLEEMVVPRAAPVSPAAQQLLSEVETKVLPSIAQRQKQEPAEKVQAALVGRWAKAVSDYGEMSAAYLFDRAGFETKLQELHSQTESEMLRIAGGTADEIKLALEVLRRKAVLKRNAFIQENLLPLLEKADYLGEGDAVWRVFFEAVNSNRGDVFAPSVSAREGTTADGILSSEAASTSILSYTWKAIQLDDVVHTPSVTAAVALYVTLLSIEVSKLLLQDESLRSASSHLDEGIGRKQQQHHESPAQRDVRRFQLVESTIKRKFIQDTIATLLATSPGSAALARALGEVGLHDLSRETALCNAMSDTSSLEGDEVKNLVGGFESTAEVKTLLASILAGNNQEVRQHVLSTFGVISSEKQATSINVDALMARVDWTTNWRRLTADLLRHTPTIECMRALVRNAIGAKGTTKVLYSASYADKLEEVKRSRDEREARKQERLKRIVSELSSHHNVNTSIEMCRVHSGSLLPEIDFTVLQAEVTKAHSSTQSQRQSVDLRVLDGVLGLVRRRHPQWVEAGVLPREANPLSNSLEGLQMMVRMFVRLVYVPQAGAAAIAQRTRRRIGAIGKEPHEFNVPAEVGIVEQFDNLQYKRYDWQGWYQRMVDIHNRNVSIRCRLDDLKRLDGAGNPFVDVQTERRLRILSADRVGMGVLKLDSDKYEDQADNLTFCSTRLSSLLADSRKAQLGPEYWPTVEVKVRRPSGQSQAYYSTMDQDRIEKTSKTLYEKYRDAKKRSLFVTPMDLWLDVKGMQVRQKVDRADEHGYTVDSLQDTLNDGGSA